MKIYHENKHVKTIPAKFLNLGLETLGIMFSKSEKKRLSRDERIRLELYLFWNTLSKPFQEQINPDKHEGIEYVNVKHGDSYYRMKFGKLHVRVPNRLASLFDHIPTVNRVV